MTEPLAIREVALAQARTLARRGRFAEAEELLNEAWAEAEPSVGYLDLLARIHAQQGHLGQADEYWRQAERLDPDNAAAIEGRRRIGRLRARPRRRSGLVAVAVCVVVVLAGVIAVAVETGGDARAKHATTAAPRSATPSRPATPPSRDVLAAIDLHFAGIRAHRAPRQITVTFDRGLFRRRAAFSPSGRTVLHRLCARLRPYSGRIVVTVIGHTDGRPVEDGTYASNMELGEARAGAVREVLSRVAGIPTSRISVSSLGNVMPPDSGRGRAAAARNRTVTLRISEA